LSGCEISSCARSVGSGWCCQSNHKSIEIWYEETESNLMILFYIKERTGLSTCNTYGAFWKTKIFHFWNTTYMYSTNELTHNQAPAGRSDPQLFSAAFNPIIIESSLMLKSAQHSLKFESMLAATTTHLHCSSSYPLGLVMPLMSKYLVVQE